MPPTIPLPVDMKEFINLFIFALANVISVVVGGYFCFLLIHKALAWTRSALVGNEVVLSYFSDDGSDGHDYFEFFKDGSSRVTLSEGKVLNFKHEREMDDYYNSLQS